ncbi:hypothetical protein [Streptosporangium sp. NPDC051022]|uniref:single-stranded DNA-binding protein n=1 Tax=Streptosporangium sp. NPDC051022 TaxID=3155752 RepID=UPI003424D818
MDRNEVILVGRLPEAVRVRSLQSGSTLGTWRMIVRRQQRGRGTRVDTIPCASFEPEVTVAVAEWLPDDMVEVVGALRRRWWGADGAKSSGYEVEVRSARRLERPAAVAVAADDDGRVSASAPPRPVRSLLPARDVPERGKARRFSGSGLAPDIEQNDPASVRRCMTVPHPRDGEPPRGRTDAPPGGETDASPEAAGEPVNR